MPDARPVRNSRIEGAPTGHEYLKCRPALVLSSAAFNETLGLAYVALNILAAVAEIVADILEG